MADIYLFEWENKVAQWALILTKFSKTKEEKIICFW